VLWPKVGLEGSTCQAGWLARVVGRPSFLFTLTLGIGCPVHRPSLTRWQSEFKKAPIPARLAKEVGPAGPSLAQLGPGFVPHHPLVSYYL
jgi:hypothetical protein